MKFSILVCMKPFHFVKAYLKSCRNESEIYMKQPSSPTKSTFDNINYPRLEEQKDGVFLKSKWAYRCIEDKTEMPLIYKWI